MMVSFTDLCNLRCRYCMPAEGVQKKSHSAIMSEEEIITVIEAAAELGIKKIRFTGGEPLIKKNIISICRKTHEIPAVHEICITTNGNYCRRSQKASKRQVSHESISDSTH